MFELPVDDELPQSRNPNYSILSFRRKRDDDGESQCPGVKKYGFCLGIHYNDSNDFLNIFKTASTEDLDSALAMFKLKLDKQIKPWQIESWKEKWKKDCPMNSKKRHLSNLSMIKTNVFPCHKSIVSSLNKTSFSRIHQINNNLARNNIPFSNNALNTTRFDTCSMISNKTKNDHTFKNPSNFIQPTFSKKKKPITLKDWSLKFSPNRNELVMFGTCINSSVQIRGIVSRRMNKYTIVTKDDQQIHFTGPIKENDKDIPRYILNKFTFGFGEDWEKDINIWKEFINQGKPQNFNWPDLPSELQDYFHKTQDTLEVERGSDNECNDLSITSPNNENEAQMQIIETTPKKTGTTRKLDFNRINATNKTNDTRHTKTKRMSKNKNSNENYLVITKWFPIYDKKNSNPILIRGEISTPTGEKLDQNENIISIDSIRGDCEFISTNETIYRLEGPVYDPDKELPLSIYALCDSNFLNNYNEIMKIWSNLMKPKRKNVNLDDKETTIKKSSKGRILQTPQRFSSTVLLQQKSTEKTPNSPKLIKKKILDISQKLNTTNNLTDKSKRNSNTFKRKSNDNGFIKSKRREIELFSLDDVRDTPPGVNIFRCLQKAKDTEEKDESIIKESRVEIEPLNRRMVNAYLQRQRKLNVQNKKEDISKKKEFKISSKANKLYKELTSDKNVESIHKYNYDEENEEEEEIEEDNEDDEANSTMNERSSFDKSI